MRDHRNSFSYRVGGYDIEVGRISRVKLFNTEGIAYREKQTFVSETNMCLKELKCNTMDIRPFKLLVTSLLDDIYIRFSISMLKTGYWVCPLFTAAYLVIMWFSISMIKMYTKYPLYRLRNTPSIYSCASLLRWYEYCTTNQGRKICFVFSSRTNTKSGRPRGSCIACGCTLSARVTCCHVSWAPRIVEGCTVNVPPSALWGSPVVGLPHAKRLVHIYR